MIKHHVDYNAKCASTATNYTHDKKKLSITAKKCGDEMIEHHHGVCCSNKSRSLIERDEALHCMHMEKEGRREGDANILTIDKMLNE